ncbi:MAG TPA: SGNH/GDSL hydrolase family protein [Burkholderiaceae bacterium]|jgi:lysophospholipase L1-like esterase
MKLSKSNRIGRAALLAALLASALLTSCGGGEQVQKFQALRIIAFGDENSVITSTGAKYTINAVQSPSTTTPTTLFDCAINPIWIQAIASAYGLGFPQCNPLLLTEPSSRIYATKGAMVADLATQIDQQQADGGFVDGDMVTVMVGVNDIIAEFAQYPVLTQDELNANATAAGTALAQQVNRLAALGAKVIISTIPYVGLMPFAGDRTPGTTNNNPNILNAMSAAFNDGMLKNLTNDGHFIGLVQLDQYLLSTDAATQNNVGPTFVNTTLAACAPTAPLPTCTSQTLVPDAIGFSWLWADDRHLSDTGQASFGSLAVTRAQNNPF